MHGYNSTSGRLSRAGSRGWSWLAAKNKAGRIASGLFYSYLHYSLINSLISFVLFFPILSDNIIVSSSFLKLMS